MKKDRSIEDFIAALREAHEAWPDLRVGQIVVNALHVSWGCDPFYVENDELVRGIRARLPKAQAEGEQA